MSLWRIASLTTLYITIKLMALITFENLTNLIKYYPINLKIENSSFFNQSNKKCNVIEYYLINFKLI